MISEDKFSMSRHIINKSLEFGASLAGIVNIEELKKSPSHDISTRIADFEGVGTKDVEGRKLGEVKWIDNTKSGVVIAVEHPKKKPELDWWTKGLNGGTKGNKKLISIFSKLADWIEENTRIKCIKLAYNIEHGAVYMKDAAVLGGIGCYNRFQCNVQMEKDIKNARSVIIQNGKSKSQEVRYCRRCEIACPIGK